MNIPLKLLLVEDSEADAVLLVRSLQKDGYEIVVERVETGSEMQTALERQTWDLVISDYSLPQFSAEDALASLLKTGLDIPFIVVSGTIGEDIAVTMMQAGAHDYVMKGKLSRLAPAVERELKEAENRRERRLAEQGLHESEASFATVFHSNPASIAITRFVDNYLIDVNTAWEKMTGWTKTEVIGHTPNELNLWVNPGSRLSLIEILKKQGKAENIEMQIRRKDGAIADLLMSAEMIHLSGEKFILTMAQDITSIKRSEGQIKRQVEYLNTLQAIDTVITSSFNLHISLDFILKQAVSTLGVDAADILVFNPYDRSLDYSAGFGLRILSQLRPHLRIGQGYAGRIALEKRKIYIADSSLTAGERTESQSFLPPGEGIITYYGVPLLAKGQVKGVLELFHRSPLHPDEEWKNFVETLASQVAIAIDNLELFDKLQQANLELVLAYDSTLEGLGSALDYRQKESEGHTKRVSEMMLDLARALNMGEKDLVSLRRGALLHDIGMLSIPESILLKPGALTDEEKNIVQHHPLEAQTWLAHATYLRQALDIPFCHHEQWDGNGYPRRLKGENIPLAARIFTVVHHWDVLQSDRPYRKAWPRQQVVAYLWEQSGVIFDPAVVKAFFETFRDTRS